MIMTAIKNFDELKTSTMTIMCYSNLNFNIPAIFKRLPITSIEVPLTKKQRNVDKKRIVAPYGAVISVQAKTQIRGIDLRKRKKHWCTVCQPKKVMDEREVKVITVTEKLVNTPAVDEDGYGKDVKSIVYSCSRCQKDYNPSEIKKINHFLNQLTIVLSVGKQPLLNIMLFRDNLKIAGCKNIDDAAEAILILWDNFLY